MLPIYADLVVLCLSLISWAVVPSLAADDKPASEKQKIEALIKHVEGLKGAVFIRNDKEYDAETAAKFLRGKWETQAAEIRTAQEFIEKVASVSSTSGKPYRIRLKEGEEKKSGEYLLEQLKKLEGTGEKRSPEAARSKR